MEIVNNEIRVLLPDSTSPEDQEHLQILLSAFLVYQKRNSGQRREVWRHSGVTGQVVHLFAKAERAFQAVLEGYVPDPDHFLDAINYAAFAIRLGNDLKGQWPWR